MPTKKKQCTVVLSEVQECKLRHLSDLYGFSKSKILRAALDFYCTRIDHYYEQDKKGEALRSALSAIAERVPPK